MEAHSEWEAELLNTRESQREFEEAARSVNEEAQKAAVLDKLLAAFNEHEAVKWVRQERSHQKWAKYPFTSLESLRRSWRSLRRKWLLTSARRQAGRRRTVRRTPRPFAPRSRAASAAPRLTQVLRWSNP